MMLGIQKRRDRYDFIGVSPLVEAGSKRDLIACQDGAFGSAITAHAAPGKLCVRKIEDEFVASIQVPVDPHKPLFRALGGFGGVGEAEVKGGTVHGKLAVASGHFPCAASFCRGIKR